LKFSILQTSLKTQMIDNQTLELLIDSETKAHPLHILSLIIK